jgi:tRNA 2-thiouridine synthesizing protein A
VRGLNCPLPVLKARRLLKAMQPGQRLRVLATDPRAPADMTELCAATGWGLIESRQEGEAFAFLLERR